MPEWKRKNHDITSQTLSLYPMKFEDAVKAIAKAKPEPKKPRKA